VTPPRSIPGMERREDEKMEIFDVIVIGGGPAGCMTAIKAGERGKSVLLIERNNEIGKKLLLTGNKRGNLTHIEDIEDFLTRYRNGSFLRNGFARFFNSDLIAFFESKGLPLKVERGNRVYPESDDAGDIVKTLIRVLKETGVKLNTGRLVTDIIRKSGFFEVFASKKRFMGRKVVIACGGRSFPKTGSSGGGYMLAKKTGHTVTKTVPALCGIEVRSKNITRSCCGITLKNVRITASLNGKKIGEEFGEVLFTHYGLSGPAVLNLSGAVSENLDRGEVKLSINLKPALSEEKIDSRLCRELKTNPRKQLKNLLKNILPAGLISSFLQYAGVAGEKQANQCTREERNKITKTLMGFEFLVSGPRSFTDSMVTRGGVDVSQINPKTMESKVTPGVFFAGEVIDIDGKTGGYNLQAAFTTGYLAGTSV
jgi:predicted Rossmann fold flavoprotein